MNDRKMWREKFRDIRAGGMRWWWRWWSSQENQKATREKKNTLYSKKKIKRINTRAVPLVRYSGPFLKWTREEIKQMDQRTRKLMTMHKALHPWDEVAWLCLSRKEGRELAKIEDNVDTSMQRLEYNIKKHRGRLITATRNNTDNTRTNRTKITRKRKLEEKYLYERFKWRTNDISHGKTWAWLKKGNLMRETESLLISLLKKPK